MLSMHANEEYVLQSLKAGASGYMLKDATPNELELAIRSVAKGGTYLTPAVSKHVIDGYMKRTKINREEIKTKESVFERITPRQREILQLIAEGNSTKQIAQKLNLSVKTVESHRKQLMERLDIHDVAGLVRYAIRMGLVSPER
jgi:DNA-binding NarL/FixJ family response regulator